MQAGHRRGDDGSPTVLNKLQKWADYPAMGAPVWPTKFIPMKTPMSSEILDNWSLAEAPKHPLTVPLLLEGQQAAGRQVGLIIDLANHDCLYSDDVPDTVEYEHVQLIAKVLPGREAVDEVERIARSFWAEHPQQHVAIHCAYGFNRTGFVVCSYLCQACGLSVEQALESFAAARPPGVKHERFIRELHARYGDGGGSGTAAAAVCAAPKAGAVQAAPAADGGLPAASLPDAAMPDVSAGAIDGLAVEAERLRQAAATQRKAAREPSPPPSPAQQQQQWQEQWQEERRQQQQQQAPAQAGSVEEEEEEEVPHFEDAAVDLRQRSLHRQSMSRQGSDSAPFSPAAPGRSSQPGSHGSSFNASRHGGSPEVAAAAGGIARASVRSNGSEEEAGLATAPAAPEALAASRRLLQRMPSRGSGGALSAALAAAAASGGSAQLSGGSPGGSSPGATAGSGGSPRSASRTAYSSFSDFASAAVHLESQHSMRRTTSLGLAKALTEDFQASNGTPSNGTPSTAPVAPIAAASAWEQQQEAAAAAAAAAAARPRLPPDSPPSDDPCAGGSSSSSDGAAAARGNGGADAVCWMQGSPPREPSVAARSGGGGMLRPSQDGGSSAALLGTSPSKRGGIPMPPNASFQQQQQPVLAPLRRSPVPAAWMAAAAAQSQQHVAGQQPGTPLTPASSSATPSALGSSFQRSVGGGASFMRSVSVDSDNPSLGFDAREALQQLRGAGGFGLPDAGRGPQALADLFREDSHAELAELDVEEHLAALAMGAGVESPATRPGPLPKVVADALASQAAAAGGAGGAGRAAAQPGSSSQPCRASGGAAAHGHQPGAQLRPGGSPAAGPQQAEQQPGGGAAKAAAADLGRGRQRSPGKPCSIM